MLYGIGLVVEGTCFFPPHQGSNLHVHACHPRGAMLTGFAGYSVGRGISRGARKLTRTPT